MYDLQHLYERKGQTYERGCLMAYFKECKEHDEITNQITKEELHDNGIEDEPHVTILYGFEPGVDKDELGDIINIDELKQFSILFTGLHSFENPEFDVLIYRGESSVLYDLNNMCRALPHQNKFKDYVPHMTIAYLKSGMAKKYLYQPFAPFLIKCDRLVYSAVEFTKDGNTKNVKYEWKLPAKDPLEMTVGHSKKK